MSVHWLSYLPIQCKQDLLCINVTEWDVPFSLGHKRLIRALQTYLHCKGLPLNTSQGLINALFKSCAPITNWLELGASSITQKRPLQIKIPMIYTWKTLKGISSLLMNHKCFKHPKFCSWCWKKKKRKEIEGLSECCMHVFVCVRGRTCMCVFEWVGLWRDSEFEMCFTDTETHISPTGKSVSMRQKRGMKQPFSQTRHVYRKRILIQNVKWLEITLHSDCIETIVPIGRVLFSLNAMGPLAHLCNINYTIIELKYMLKCVMCSWVE